MRFAQLSGGRLKDKLMAKLYIHIGLPKTATTTLQTDFFQLLDSKSIKYVGVRQPRSISADPEYDAFIKAIYQGTGIAEVREMFSRVLEGGTSLLLSEEMITVSQVGATWQDKLVNCAEILDGFDYKILVTVRDPVSAMFSYYVELISQYSFQKEGFVDIALHDEAMKIYHSNYFFNWLFGVFERERVCIVSFEDIISGKFSRLVSFFDGMNSSFQSISLTNQNVKRTTDELVFTGRKRTPLMMVERWLDLRGWVKCKKILKWRAFQPLLKLSGKLSLGEIVVRRPSDDERQYLCKELEEEIKFHQTIVT